MKIFLCCLAAIVLAAAMVSFLARSVSPLGRMTLTKEALDKAPDRTDGYEIAFQAIKDPSGSQIVAPLDKPSNPFNATSAWVRRNLIGVESWIKQAIRAGRDTPAAEARREGNV